MWQMNERINRDVTDLAWSALPHAPVIADGPRGIRVLRRRMASILRATAGRLDDRVGVTPRGTPSTVC
jgi:hypothetical protein